MVRRTNDWDRMMRGGEWRSRTVRGRAVAVLTVIAVLALHASSALAAPGALDPSFGSGGVVTTDFGGEDNERDVAVDLLGRIVVVGNSEVSESEEEIVVARYTPSGALDPSFGGGAGFVQLHFGANPWDDALAVAVYDDGRIVVAGQTAFDPICNTACEAAVLRLTESGLPDPSFSGDGVFMSGVNFSRASAVTVDGSGRIVVGEHTEIFRLTEAGALDASFDGDGRAPVDNGASLGVALDASGRIVATDYFNGEATAVRLLATGAPDPGFDGNGYATASIAPGSLDYPEALALDPSGRVLVVGQTLLPGEIEGRLFMLRFTASGALDPGFGSSGVVLGDENSWAGDLALDASGRLLVAGFWPSLDPLGSLFRFTPSGALDPDFGGDGAVLSLGSDISIDPEQRIVAAGSRLVDDSDFSVARYLGGDAPPAGEEPLDEPPGEEPSADPPASSPASSPPVNGGQQVVTVPRAALAIAARVAPVKGSVAFLRLRCSGQANCRGVAKLLGRVRFRRGARRSTRRVRNVVLGRSRFQVPAGKARLLRIRLNRKGRRLLRRAGRRGLWVQLIGRGVRNRAVRLKRRQGKRRRSRRARRMLTSARSSGRRHARRGHHTAYPVKITIKHRKTPKPGCPACEAFFGAVHSPKPACKRGRKVQGAVTYPKSIFGGRTYEESFGRTDRRGRWKREFIAIKPLARATSTVKRKRLRSGAACRAARASVRYRR